MELKIKNRNLSATFCIDSLFEESLQNNIEKEVKKFFFISRFLRLCMYIPDSDDVI